VQLAVVRPGGRATAEPSSFVKSLWAISLDSSRNSAQPIIWPIVWWLSFIEYMMSPAPNQPVKSEWFRRVSFALLKLIAAFSMILAVGNLVEVFEIRPGVTSAAFSSRFHVRLRRNQRTQGITLSILKTDHLPGAVNLSSRLCWPRNVLIDTHARIV
jgi:hypothetical protein